MSRQINLGAYVQPRVVLASVHLTRSRKNALRVARVQRCTLTHPLSSGPKSVPRVPAPPKRARYCARHSERAFLPFFRFFLTQLLVLVGKDALSDRLLSRWVLLIHLSIRLPQRDGIKIFPASDPAHAISSEFNLYLCNSRFFESDFSTRHWCRLSLKTMDCEFQFLK